MSQVFSDSSPVARKQHVCDLCQLPIAKGDRYNRRTGIWEDVFATFKAHIACDEFATKIYDDENDWESHDVDCFRQMLSEGQR